MSMNLYTIKYNQCYVELALSADRLVETSQQEIPPRWSE